MIRWIFLCALLLCTVDVAARETEEPLILGCISPTPLHLDKSDELIVHEWGTFTTLQGSDGKFLSGLYREEEHLPPFVYHHGGFSPDPSTQGEKGLYRPLLNATVKMETPVLYFYSPTAVNFSARVDFPQGTISQWYPQRTDGETMPTSGEDLDLGTPFNGWIEWKGTILDPTSSAKYTPPANELTPTWTAPRKTDANLVQAHNGEVEKFLFYRGVGNFETPISASFSAAGELVISNTGSESVPYAFVFNKEQNGTTEVWWTGALAAGERRAIERPDSPPVAQQRFAEFEQALAEAGLYPKEAAAMLDTWRASYFETPGLRVFWIAPRSFTDKILPVEFTPEPTGFERVIVGRSEVLSPSFEKQLVSDFTTGKEDFWRNDRYYLAYQERVQQILASAPVTSVEELDSTVDELLVYPNPTSGKLTVELQLAAGTEQSTGKVRLALSSVVGSQLMTSEGELQQNNSCTFQLNLESYAVGMYIITVEANGKTWTRKVARK